MRSTGEYIGFMDCDDWIEKDMYETLVKAMEENDVDMAAASWSPTRKRPEKYSTRRRRRKNRL